MSSRTNLAEILTHVFEMVDKNIPNQQNTGPNLLQVWTSVLGGPERSYLDVLASIGQISSIMVKLQTQINESKKLKDFQKRSALNTLNQFSIFFAAEHFSGLAATHKPRCNETHRGNLGILGLSLEDEYSEPKVEAHDAESLIEELKLIIELVDGSAIPIHLRVNLKKHLNTMIWWLSHPEMASLQDIFETSGAAILISKQIVDQEDSKDDDKKKSIFDNIMSFATKVGKMVGLVDKGMQGADGLITDVHHLISSIST